ncbi:MAG: hypothetical protein NVS2B7_31460 [Herpetosiphon sp.]
MSEQIFPEELLQRVHVLPPQQAAQAAAMYLSAQAEDLVAEERLIDASYLDGLTACCNAFEQALFFAEHGSTAQPALQRSPLTEFERELVLAFYREIAVFAREAVRDGHDVRQR